MSSNKMTYAGMNGGVTPNLGKTIADFFNWLAKTDWMKTVGQAGASRYGNIKAFNGLTFNNENGGIETLKRIYDMSHKAIETNAQEFSDAMNDPQSSGEKILRTIKKRDINDTIDYFKYFNDNFAKIMQFILTYEKQNGDNTFLKNANITNTNAEKFSNFVAGYMGGIEKGYSTNLNSTQLPYSNRAQECENSYYSPNFVLGSILGVGAACLLVGSSVSSAITYHCAKRPYTPVSQNADKV